MAAFLHDEYRTESDGDEFPLYSEETVPQGGAEYQACKTDTRFWRACEGPGVTGAHICVYGPRGTRHGYALYGPDGARQAAGKVIGAAMGDRDKPRVLAPWYAEVKGAEQHYALTRGEALCLGWTLQRLARELEEEARVASLAPYDVPGLFMAGALPGEAVPA